MKIKFFAKKNCSPCDFFYTAFQRKFKEGKFEKIVAQDNDEALMIVGKYKTRSFPFLVINDNTVISTADLQTLIFAIKNT